MAEINNFSVYKGENIELDFTLTPATDITGWTIVFTLKRLLEDGEALASIQADLDTPLSGEFSISIPSDTLLLPAGVYYYDVQRTDAGSRAVLSIGKLTVLQEVQIA